MPRGPRKECNGFLEDDVLGDGIEDVGLLVVEGDLHLVADLDLVTQRDLRDHVDATEVAVDVVFVTEKLGDGDVDVIGDLGRIGLGIVDVFGTDTIADIVFAFEGFFEGGDVLGFLLDKGLGVGIFAFEGNELRVEFFLLGLGFFKRFLVEGVMGFDEVLFEFDFDTVLHGDDTVLITGVDDVHGRGADEGRDEEVGRVVIDVNRGADLLDVTPLHDDDAARHGHSFGLVVGDVDGRRAERFVEFDDFGTHLDTEFRVEVGQRFVHQEDFRVTDDGTAEGDTLTLTTRKGLWLTVEIFFDLKDAGSFADAAVDFLAGKATDAETKGHVVVDRHVRIQGVGLEDHRDVAVFRGAVVGIFAIDPEFAAGDVFQTGDHTKGRGFAAARRSDEDDEFLLGDFEVEIEDGLDVVVVDLVDVTERNVSGVGIFLRGGSVFDFFSHFRPPMCDSFRCDVGITIKEKEEVVLCTLHKSTKFVKLDY